ncbi:MAG: bifunctional phosphoribosyl-AMP cyclohydrolase/phosphoribosyl-ATP diphosphatase HisIE [Longimicrobiales bacterium]
MTLDRPEYLDALDYTKADGLVPVVTQHATTGEVLMLGFANRDALERTLAERRMSYWSRSRSALWRKGETSGNEQDLVSLHTDCDGDAVLACVLPRGPTCHTGAWSCFAARPTLAGLAETIRLRLADTGGSGYTRRLLDDENLRLKKLAEEALELALACKSRDAMRIAEEAADVLYHTLVACAAADVTLRDVLAVLDARRRASASAEP